MAREDLMNTSRRCYGCGLFGHYRRECPTNPYVQHSRRQKVKPAERHKAKQAEYCENTTSTSNDECNEYDEKSNEGICQNQELPLGTKYTASVSGQKLRKQLSKLVLFKHQ